MKKIIVTARDPASANDIAEILPDLISNGELEVKIIAQEPAYGIFFTKLEYVDQLDIIQFEFSNNSDRNEYVILNMFNKFEPNILLTGISGPDNYGIDEIALKVSEKYDSKIKTFSVQSYWGDLNDSCGVLAENIFVLDEFAKEATLKRHKKCNVIISGPLQSKRYDAIDIEKERDVFRKKHLKNSDNIKIIGFFGQPLFEYEWYKRTISVFLEELTKVNMSIIIAYKSHPKETEESIAWMINKIKKSKINYFIVEENEVLKVLPGTDMAVSAFSTIGYDLLNLLTRSGKVFSTPMYLFFDKKCVKWYQKNCMLREIPMSKNNISIVVESQDDLDSCIEYALTNKRMNSHVNNKQNLLNNNHGHLLFVSTIFDSCFNGEKYKPCSIT